MIMADMKKLLHTFDEADEILNDKIERTNLSTIVASATASVENKKTVLIRGTGRNIEVLKVGGKTVQNGTPTPTNPVEVKGVGDYDEETGKYKIPILTDGKSQNIYLNAPLFDGEIADLVGGKVNKKWGFVDLGTLDWTYEGADGIPSQMRIDGGDFVNSIVHQSPNNKCSAYNYVTFKTYDQVPDKTICFSNSSTRPFLRIRNTAYTDEASFKNALKGVYFLCELKESVNESFDGSEIPVGSGEVELTLNTDVTPSSIEAVTFGDYYSKAEADKKFESSEIISGNGTINSTYGTGRCNWFIVGKICSVDIIIDVSSAISGDVVLVSGMPESIGEMWISVNGKDCWTDGASLRSSFNSFAVKDKIRLHYTYIIK